MQIITFTGAKGGAGTTVTACAAALVLARAGRHVTIIDHTRYPQVTLGGDVCAVFAIATMPTTPDLIDLAPGIRLAHGAGQADEKTDVLIVDRGSRLAYEDGERYDGELSVLVTRGCYLALRRAVQSPILADAAGIVLVDEQGRSLGSAEVKDVLDQPVLARIPARAAIARAVDAGILAARLPDALARPTRRLLETLGTIEPVTT